MHNAALHILFFMIGYLLRMKQTNRKEYGAPELNIQIYFVLFKRNNTYVPSTFFNVIESNSGKTFVTNNFNEFFNEPDQDSSISKQPIVDFHFNNNVREINIGAWNIESFLENLFQDGANYTEVYSEERLHSDILNETVENENISIICNETSKDLSKPFDNASIIIYHNTTLLLEVNERHSELSIKNLTSEIKSVSKDNNLYNGTDNSANDTNISAEFLNGYGTSDGNRFFIKKRRINKVRNGVYFAINPCVYKNFYVSRVKGYKFVTRNKKSLPKIIEFLIKRTSKDTDIVWNVVDESLQTAMAVYYDDMTMLDYSINDIIRFVIYPNYWLFILAIILSYIYIKPLILYYRPRGNLFRKNTFSNFENSHQHSLTKNEIMDFVLEMKEVQNHYLVKMEYVLNQTNIKLQFLLNKLGSLEDFMNGRRMKETHTVLKSVVEHTKSNNRQIKELRIEHNKSINFLHSFSINLDKTQDDLEELKDDCRNISENQANVIKKLSELKLHLNNSDRTNLKKDLESRADLLVSEILGQCHDDGKSEINNMERSNQFKTTKYSFIQQCDIPLGSRLAHQQENHGDSSPQFGQLSDSRKIDLVSRMDSKSNDNFQGLGSLNQSVMRNHHLLATGKLKMEQTEEKIQVKNSKQKTVQSAGNAIISKCEHVTFNGVSSIVDWKNPFNSVTHTSSVFDIHTTSSPSKTFVFRKTDPKKSYTLVSDNDKSTDSRICDNSKAEERPINSLINDDIALKTSSPFENITQFGKPGDMMEDLSMKIKRSVPTLVEETKTKSDGIQTSNILKEKTALEDEKRVNTDEPDSVDEQITNSVVKKENIEVKKEEIRGKTEAELNKKMLGIKNEVSSKGQLDKIDPNCDVSCSYFSSISGFKLTKREVKQIREQINKKRISTHKDKTNKEFYTSFGGIKQVRDLHNETKKNFRSRHKCQGGSGTASDSEGEETIKIRLPLNGPSTLDLTNNSRTTIKEDDDIENNTKVSETNKELKQLNIFSGQNKTNRAANDTVGIHHSNPSSRSERVKTIKEQLLSRETRQKPKEQSSSHRMKTMKERSRSHDRAKTIQALPLKPDKMIAEEDQCLSERVKNNVGSPESLKKRKISVFESKRNRILESNPLFKKQMTQNVSDENEAG